MGGLSCGQSRELEGVVSPSILLLVHEMLGLCKASIIMISVLSLQFPVFSLSKLCLFMIFFTIILRNFGASHPV